MRKPVLRRGAVLRHGIAALCLLVTSVSLGACVYDPYTGQYVPYRAYSYPYPYSGYRYPYAYPYYRYP
jgi:hypothetical protein